MAWTQNADGTWVENTGNSATTPDNSSPWYAAPLTAITSIYQQKQLIDINADRAARGLAPISAGSIAPQVNIGLAPEQVTLLTVFGVGLLVVLYLKGKK
jgi:hypothetical protein